MKIKWLKKAMLNLRYDHARKVVLEIRRTAAARRITEDAAVSDWLRHGYKGLPHG